MDITSKSIDHANFIIVFEEGRFVMPDNSSLNTLYQGPATAGARFIDDPVLRTKFLDLPNLKIQVTVEPNRLRIDDTSQGEPVNSRLVNETISVYQKLFTKFPIKGFGFNFDIYYRFAQLMNLENLFNNFAMSEILKKADLRDLGIQFTLEKKGGKKKETYFLKITAPIELVVHTNHHFEERKIPPLADFKKLFENCYNETDEVIQNLRF